MRARFPVLQVRGFRHDFLLQPQSTRAFYRKTLVRKRLVGRIWQLIGGSQQPDSKFVWDYSFFHSNLIDFFMFCRLFTAISPVKP